MFTWQVLNAGTFRLDGGSMFGVVPKTLWSRSVAPDDQNRIPLRANCVLLRQTTPGGEFVVLIETGYGGKWTDKERGFYDLERRTILDALREANTDPAEIDLVVVTHLHFDHAGGLTHLNESGEAVSSFPNSKIVVQHAEWTDALANRSTMTRTYLRSHLDPIADQVRLVRGESRLGPHLTVWPMPGHTWGQQAVSFRDETGIVVFPGDVMPTTNHVHLAFSMGYDMLPYENMLSKKTLLTRAAEERWRLVLDHDPATPVVRVEREPDQGDRFRLEPV